MRTYRNHSESPVLHGQTWPLILCPVCCRSPKSPPFQLTENWGAWPSVLCSFSLWGMIGACLSRCGESPVSRFHHHWHLQVCPINTWTSPSIFTLWHFQEQLFWTSGSHHPDPSFTSYRLWCSAGRKVPLCRVMVSEIGGSVIATAVVWCLTISCSTIRIRQQSAVKWTVEHALWTPLPNQTHWVCRQVY